jgi:electron transfer flavoprotein beta subunit
MKLVPDLVEELEIDEGSARLDTSWLRLIPNEPDEHALEQALLLKEAGDAEVIVMAVDGDDTDDLLYASAAKGSDRIIKIIDGPEELNNHALARVLQPMIGELGPDLVLTGVQAHDDLDGSVGPLLAAGLGWPYVGYVSGVEVSGDRCTVKKEFPEGVVAELEVDLPAVLGIQAASQPPRYVAVSKVRQIMKTTVTENFTARDVDLTGGAEIRAMSRPALGERASMLEGDEADIAEQLVVILQKAGVL